MNDESQRWSAWIGRSERRRDVLEPARAEALQATLGLESPVPGPDEPLPPLWHWLYFWTPAPAGKLGPDGHPARGGLLPPIDLPRRMWAGSRIAFRRPLVIGREVERVSTIDDVQAKLGRSGRLAFVTLRHRISDAGALCVEEEHDIVYREAPISGAPSRPAVSPAERSLPAAPPWTHEVRPDPVLLFRYSALTFNGHRIHYDPDYAREAEGYPGLVVHGTLLATLMVELARRERRAATVTAFRLRALSPLFDTAPFTVAGEPAADGTSAQLWVVGPEGEVAMDGGVDLA